MKKGFHSTGAELDRKYWIALGLYAVLAVLVWFTMGEGTVLVFGRAGGVAVASADCDRRHGLAYGFGSPGGEDSPRRGWGWRFDATRMFEEG